MKAETESETKESVCLVTGKIVCPARSGVCSADKGCVFSWSSGVW